MSNFLKKYYNLSLPVKATFWFTVCNLILKGISFITVPIFTRILPANEYGALSIFLSYEQIIMILATWEIQNGAYQKGLFKYKKNIRIFTVSTQALVNILTIIFFLIVFAGRKWFEQATGMPNSIIILLFVYLLVQPSYTCWLIRKRTEYAYRSAIIVTLLYTILNIGIPMFAILYIDNTAVVKYGATLISSIFVCLFFFIPNMKPQLVFKRMGEIKKQWIFLIKFEAPLVLHSLSYLILSQADRIMIGFMVGNSEAAYYSVAYSLASVVNIFQNSINQALLPWRYEMLEKKNYKKIFDITTYLLLGMAGIVIIVVLIAPEVMKILFEDNYYEAVWSMPPITAGVYFMFLYTIFVNIESYFEKTQYIMYVSVTCGILNIILNYLCINRFGYIACGYTTLVSYIFFSFGHFYFMNRIIKKELIEAQIINKRATFLISFMVIILSVAITLIYPYAFIRYGVLVCIVIYIVINRKNIEKIFKQIKNGY
mgnify:CR=1 FL=1